MHSIPAASVTKQGVAIRLSDTNIAERIRFRVLMPLNDNDDDNEPGAGDAYDSLP